MYSWRSVVPNEIPLYYFKEIDIKNSYYIISKLLERDHTVVRRDQARKLERLVFLKGEVFFVLLERENSNFVPMEFSVQLSTVLVTAASVVSSSNPQRDCSLPFRRQPSSPVLRGVLRPTLSSQEAWSVCNQICYLRQGIKTLLQKDCFKRALYSFWFGWSVWPSMFCLGLSKALLAVIFLQFFVAENIQMLINLVIFDLSKFSVQGLLFEKNFNSQSFHGVK